MATAETTCQATATLATQGVEVEQWASDKELQTAAQKSTGILFSSKTRELNTHPSSPFNNITLPNEKHLNILRVTFDPTLTFCTNVDSIVKKAKSGLANLKAMTGTTRVQ